MGHHQISSIERKFSTVLLLSLLFGWLGVDRFYLGQGAIGFLKLITLGGFGIWYFIDVFIIASRSIRWVKYEKEDTWVSKNPYLTIVIFFGALIFLSVILSSGSEDYETQNLNQQLESKIEANQQPSTKREDFSVEIISRKTFNFIGNGQFGLGKKPSGTFLVFNIQLENKGTEPIYISSYDVILHDNEGRKFVTDSEAMIYWQMDHQNSFVFETINPGIRSEGVVIFDVPDPKADFQLGVRNNLFSLLD